MDVEEIKGRMKVVWGLGDYALLSEQLRPAAGALCEACAVSAGQEVLDVGAGDGNFALAAAREGADVVASDLSPAMVERGRARTRAEGYDVEWVEADAEDLPFEDERFDCVGSVFGAMIAPRPEVVARELFRVVRPGGTVGMTAWRDDAFVPQLGQIASGYVPRDPDQPLPEEWADEETVRSRFEGLAARVDFEIGTLVWEREWPEAFIADLEAGSGPIMAAKKALPPERFEAMSAEVLELVRRLGGDGPVVMENHYTRIVARKRG